jgi:hypothetical protein
MQNTAEELEKFNEQADVALSRANTFIEKYNENLIPENIKIGMYKMIRAQIIGFSILTPVFYKN